MRARNGLMPFADIGAQLEPRVSRAKAWHIYHRALTKLRKRRGAMRELMGLVLLLDECRSRRIGEENDADCD